MKKLFLIILLMPLGSFAMESDSSDDEILTEAQAVLSKHHWPTKKSEITAALNTGRQPDHTMLCTLLRKHEYQKNVEPVILNIFLANPKHTLASDLFVDNYRKGYGLEPRAIELLLDYSADPNAIINKTSSDLFCNHSQALDHEENDEVTDVLVQYGAQYSGRFVMCVDPEDDGNVCNFLCLPFCFLPKLVMFLSVKCSNSEDDEGYQQLVEELMDE